MSPRSEILKQIVGKTITGIVLRESEGPGPRYQLFMIFNDNTYLEFYGEMGWSNRLEIGDLETVKQYAARFSGNLVVIT
jgi:hypothetical protein